MTSVLKRLEEIERTHLAYARCEGPDFCNLAWLLRMIRALLESQGELMKVAGNCGHNPAVECYCKVVLAHAERVRKGEV